MGGSPLTHVVLPNCHHCTPKSPIWHLWVTGTAPPNPHHCTFNPHCGTFKLPPLHPEIPHSAPPVPPTSQPSPHHCTSKSAPLHPKSPPQHLQLLIIAPSNPHHCTFKSPALHCQICTIAAPLHPQIPTKPPTGPFPLHPQSSPLHTQTLPITPPNLPPQHLQILSMAPPSPHHCTPKKRCHKAPQPLRVRVLLDGRVQLTLCPPLPLQGSPAPKTATADVRALKIDFQTSSFINTCLKLALLPGGWGGEGQPPSLAGDTGGPRASRGQGQPGRAAGTGGAASATQR